MSAGTVSCVIDKCVITKIVCHVLSVNVQFAEENEQLLEHVTTMVDEVRQIEGRVIEISKLQEMFSQKVFQQVS